MTHPISHAYRTGLIALLLATVIVPSAVAAEQIYFPAVTDVRAILIQKISAETVRVDMSVWLLSEHAISIALVNKYKSGVPVRLIGDRGSIFETNPQTRAEFYWLASQGVPIRLRFNPTWYPEIDHWKATIFAGQNLVAFGSANYTPFELAPVSTTNYKDETVLFSDDPVIVNALKTKFDRIWNDTTFEPRSVAGGPPYFKNWDDACTAEPTGNCGDYHTLYPNRVPMAISTARLEPDNPLPADLIWGQGPDFNNRLVQEISNEPSLVQFVIFRLTVDNITQALIDKAKSGVPVRVLVEPTEYLNRNWPEFWLTHANLDRMWAAGVPIKQRVHAGLTHMKTLVTSSYATNASSNYAAAWQRDQDYFVSAAAKPAIYGAIKTRVQAMWNDSAAFGPFQPQPPDAASPASPASGAAGVSTTTPLVWNRAAFAVSYDIYLGASASGMTLVGNVPAQLVNDPPATYSWTPSAALQAGTTYYWKVVSRTNATPVNPLLIGTSDTWSFGTVAAPSSGVLPSPWSSRDVGSVSAAGSASYSNGVYTVKGAGTWIWDTTDSFQYVSQTASGDVQIVAHATSLVDTNTFAKAGVMLRETLSPNSANVVLDVRPNGVIEFMTRSASGATETFLGTATQPPPAWLRLTRSGTTVTAAVSANGSTWTTVGSTTFNSASSALVGLVVCSASSSLTTATFDGVSVSGTVAPPPSPPPSAPDIVIYASDLPSSARRGTWRTASDATSPKGIKLTTPDNGFASTDAPLAAPADYVDVTFSAVAGVPYRIWLRLQALANSKYNDAVWLQFSDATVNGNPMYRINTSSGLLINLATDSAASSLSGWGWQNGAYWLSQPTVVTFPTTGTRTLRIQVREDGVQLDQIVLSPGKYLNAAPGGVSNNSTIVAKP
jgi:hypothetical protein